MDRKKHKRLVARGWTVGTPQDFLGLTQEEARFIELKLSLSQALREERLRQEMTQVELAHRLGSSQSRVAKMESGDPKVTIDLLLKALLALGMTKDRIAEIIA